MARGSKYLYGVTVNGNRVPDTYGVDGGVPSNDMRTMRGSANVGPVCYCGGGRPHRHMRRATKW